MIRLCNVTTIRGDVRAFNADQVAIISPIYNKAEPHEWIGTRVQLARDLYLDLPITHDEVLGLIALA